MRAVFSQLTKVPDPGRKCLKISSGFLITSTKLWQETSFGNVWFEQARINMQDFTKFPSLAYLNDSNYFHHRKINIEYMYMYFLHDNYVSET